MNDDPELSEAELMCVFDAATSGAETMSDTQFEAFFDDPYLTVTGCSGVTFSPTVGVTLPPSQGDTSSPTPHSPTAAEVFAAMDTNSDASLTSAEWIAGERVRERRSLGEWWIPSPLLYAPRSPSLTASRLLWRRAIMMQAWRARA